MIKPPRTRQRVKAANAQLLADVQTILAEQGIVIVNRDGVLKFIRDFGELRVDWLAKVEGLPVVGERSRTVGARRA